MGWSCVMPALLCDSRNAKGPRACSAVRVPRSGYTAPLAISYKVWGLLVWVVPLRWLEKRMHRVGDGDGRIQSHIPGPFFFRGT